jgi:hypothetical protein
VKKKFKELLHHYKVEAFKISHSHELVEQSTREILQFTETALNNAYHYHSHEDPDPSRIETINMIKSYVLEALLPPVIEKLMLRTLVLEKQHTEMVRLLGSILEVLSEEDADSGTAEAAG